METPKPIYPAQPRWIAVVYGLLALVTMPWTIYLAVTLPSRHLSRHWDVAWVGLDVAIVIVLILNAVYSRSRSKWLAMSATATTTLLLVDAWFDIMSARPGKAFIEALVLALLVEVPLALLTFRVAIKILNRGPN